MNKGAIPGTHEPGYLEQPMMQISCPIPKHSAFRMGDCGILLSRDDNLWHLSISCLDHHPSWDEIKTARYRLLPLELTFGMLLPPPDEYVNVEAQDHVFHLWEITDPRGAQ